MRANLPDRRYFPGKSVPGRADLFITEYITDGNSALLFKAAQDRTDRCVACKIIPRSNLAARGQTDLWLDEVRKANALEHLSVLKCEGVTEWKDAEAGIDCVVLVFPFIEGRTLRDVLADESSPVTLTFILAYLETLLELLVEMTARGISHGDLNPRNILVEPRRSALRDGGFAFRIIDFGVADATIGKQPTDDFWQVGTALAKMLAAVHLPTTMSPGDQDTLAQLRDVFVPRLIETDPSRNPFAGQAGLLFHELRTPRAPFRGSHQNYPSAPLPLLGIDRATELVRRPLVAT